jgi:hypothetical protein
LAKACCELGVSLRTFQRWVGDGDVVPADGRTTAERPEPSNKLSEAERQRIRDCREFCVRGIKMSIRTKYATQNETFYGAAADSERVT